MIEGFTKFRIENNTYEECCERDLYCDFDPEDYSFYGNKDKTDNIKKWGFRYGKALIQEIDAIYGKDAQILLTKEKVKEVITDVNGAKRITINVEKYAKYVHQSYRLFVSTFLNNYFKNELPKKEANLALLDFDNPQDFEKGTVMFSELLNKIKNYSPSQKDKISELFQDKEVLELIFDNPEAISKIKDISEEKLLKLLYQIKDVSLWHSRIEKMKESLNAFNKILEEIKESRNNSDYNAFEDDEKRINIFLSENYWLLGIEYFDCEFHSQYAGDGKRTDLDVKTTNLKRPDLILKNLSGECDSIYYELEGFNDILEKRGFAGEDVIDGVSQVMRYLIDSVQENNFPKGKVIIGFAEKNSSEEEFEKKLTQINNYLKNIEILTYNKIIRNAENSINFFTTKINKSLGE